MPSVMAFEGMQPIPNFILSDGSTDNKSYYCGFGKLGADNSIVEADGPVEIPQNPDVNYNPFTLKYAPNLTWIISRKDKIISLEARDSKNKILFSASTIDGSGLSARTQSPETIVICNHKLEDVKLNPSSKSQFGVRNSSL